ncbi:hypothetical protein CLOSTMETH_03707 [[Clostridium] methylpentosum DSM 5476]|uniref:Uncharacterized protein n=1 Tax=[Clostridium] methylpentosum DSM 5476 TaxID=537013 RepID=C0EIL2_9FIRM|nr:hypothetical protein CLOSTMETH_03707 [[Clostridium] methylpentosum DSM 5476]
MRFGEKPFIKHPFNDLLFELSSIWLPSEHKNAPLPLNSLSHCLTFGVHFICRGRKALAKEKPTDEK